MPKSSKKKPILIETDDGKKILTKKFTVFLSKNKNRKHSQFTTTVAAFDERFDQTIRALLEKLFLEKVMQTG